MPTCVTPSFYTERIPETHPLPGVRGKRVEYRKLIITGEKKTHT